METKNIRHYEFSVPTHIGLIHHTKHEVLMCFDIPFLGKDFTLVLGVGLVRTIEKGNDYDIVGMDFGNNHIRKIIVKNNNARKQIYTLKKGQYAWFYGLMKSYFNEKKIVKTQLFAKAFQGWYVPKAFDIAKMEDIDIDELTQKDKEQMDLINSLVEGTKK